MSIVREITHVIAVRVKREIPEKCPTCGCYFDVDLNLTAVLLEDLPYRTRIRVGRDDVGRFYPPGEDSVGLMFSDEISYRCTKCGEEVIAPHRRTWILEAMDSKLAQQLKTLLYDPGVLDPEIKAKVFPNER